MSKLPTLHSETSILEKMKEQDWLIRLLYDVHIGKILGISAVERIQSYITANTQLAVSKAEKRMKALNYVDATPDGNYALRILQAARDDCNVQWTDNTAGLKIDNPMIEILNELQKERAKELDKAIKLLNHSKQK